MKSIILLTALLAGACGHTEAVGSVDATQPPPDTRIDTNPPPPPPPNPGQEVAAAAGHVSGGSWTADIHLGSVVSQSTASGGSWSVRGGTPVSPN